MEDGFLQTTAISEMSLASTPELFQGPDSLSKLPAWLQQMGYQSIVLLTGKKSFDENAYASQLIPLLSDNGISMQRYAISGEPSPEMVDPIASDSAADREITCVVGIGGGSVMDAAKAVAAMVPLFRTAKNRQESDSAVSVYDYLEGVGTKTPSPGRLGLVTIPTTSGTGSEATKNAVISRVGTNGFKKSLRHSTYVPDLAILDPKLTLACPKSITTASGLDAVTQLLEAYVSSASTSFTDVLAAEGLVLAGRSFPAVCEDGSNLQARNEMSLAAYYSGIALANANLGVVHGAAGLLGGIRNIPHGIACGTLLAEATKVIIDRLREVGGYDHPAIDKYSKAGYCINFDKKRKNVKYGVTLLLDTLFTWQEAYKLPGLSSFGFTADELARLAEKTALKKTPVNLSADNIRDIFIARL